MYSILHDVTLEKEKASFKIKTMMLVLLEKDL